MNFILYGVLAVGVAYGLYQFSNFAFYLFAQAFGVIDNYLQDRYMRKLHKIWVNQMMERMDKLDSIAKDAKKYNENLDDLAA